MRCFNVLQAINLCKWSTRQKQHPQTGIKVQKSTLLVQQVHRTQMVITHLSRPRPAMGGDHTAFRKQQRHLFRGVRRLLSPKASDLCPEQRCCFLFFPLCQVLLDDKVPSLNRSSFETTITLLSPVFVEMFCPGSHGWRGTFRADKTVLNGS